MDLSSPDVSLGTNELLTLRPAPTGQGSLQLGQPDDPEPMQQEGDAGAGLAQRGSASGARAARQVGASADEVHPHGGETAAEALQVDAGQARPGALSSDSANVSATSSDVGATLPSAAGDSDASAPGHSGSRRANLS